SRKRAASPPALVRATVYVQHLPRHIAGLSQVNNGVHNIFHATDRPHRRQRLQKVFRVIRVHWSVDNSGRHGIETNMFLRVLAPQTTGDGLKATLRDHRYRTLSASNRVNDLRRSDSDDASTAIL